MFDPVDPKQSLPEMEEGILQYWKEEDIFQRSLRQRWSGSGDVLDGKPGQAGESFSFYDGPPFATGLPHYGHLLAGTIKDVIPRYQTMRGNYVRRRFGWDCHGLPIENLIEKEHNINSKQEIEEMGVRQFNDLCRGAVQRYTGQWRQVVERMGRWVDMDWDYRTMDPDYMESMWWAFAQLYNKNLIYEGHKPMHICPRCVTPLSNFEVTQGYQDVTDQSVIAKFKLIEKIDILGKNSEFSEILKGEEIKLLAWTTTPWTLPGNLLLAVNPKVIYQIFRLDHYEKTEMSGVYIASTEFYNSLLSESDSAEVARKTEPIEDYHTVKDAKFDIESITSLEGFHLANLKYEPLFPYFTEEYKDKAFRIVNGDFVTTEDGTGVVHIAPGFGDDDFRTGEREGLPLLQHVTMEGKFIEAVTDFSGEEVKPKDDPAKTDRKIADWLEKNGKLFTRASYKHSYPHCWRCDSPLLNYATSSWFVRVEDIKENMLANNAKTEWVPAHIRDGRYGKWLEGARDWAISRNRYWGTPLPIWRNDQGDTDVIGSRDDLMRHKLMRFTKLTAVRHGESEGNLVPIYQGQEPGTDLTTAGREQAATAGAWLESGLPVSVIYTSPLARTRQTAEILAEKTGAQVIVDERLREVTFGDYEGKTIDFDDLSFIKAKRAKKIADNSAESVYHFPGMETWESVQGRVADFLSDTLSKHRGEHVVVVSHADPVQNMKHFFSQEDPVKISHQPYPLYADPQVFFWDHERQAQMDLHKDAADEIVWEGSPSEASVELTLVRHGQTDFNKQGKAHGRTDTPLNETGRQQAAERAAQLKDQKFDVIIASPLARAKETAEIIATALGKQVDATWEDLEERELGDWNGRLVKDIMEKNLPRHEGITPVGHHLTPPNGESLNEMLGRMEQLRQRLLTEYPGKKVLAVTHKGVFQWFSATIENLNYLDGVSAAGENAEDRTLRVDPVVRRIPEVLDCWFESGSMPYAQENFPFKMQHLPEPISPAGSGKAGVGYSSSDQANPMEYGQPPQFPADFIAEGVDQTRAWFYTLMVLSSALFGETPFKHVIVNGIVLAEDGKKMSKRLQNYPDPLEVVGRHGADAVRFTLMSSPAVRAEDLRFSEKLVEETVRSVLLPLWNTYSFFVTYANAAEFEPTENRRHSVHPLDQWIHAEVQDLVNRMTQQFDRYDLSATCAEIHETIDALTNWYVRLSRRRFAGKRAAEEQSASEQLHVDTQDDDQLDALHTLHDVLMTVCQVLSPFCPYITDAIYLNLVGEDHASIHLTDWPEPRALDSAQETLLRKTRLQRLIVSLGLSVRAEQKVKNRQPLASATIALPPAYKDLEFAKADLDLLQQELNVKEVRFTDDPGALAEAYAQVDARKVGPRLGSRVQEIIQAGKAGDFEERDGKILILDEELSPEEAQIVYRGTEGQNVAADRGVVVSLDTTIDEELRLEGLARDLIRAVQRLRKESGLAFTDTISLEISGADDVLAAHKSLIAHETKATFGENSGQAHQIDLEGTGVRIRFEKMK